MLGHSALGQKALGEAELASGGTFAAQIVPVLAAAFLGGVSTAISLGASLTPAFASAILTETGVGVALSAALAPQLAVSITGDSDGNVIVIPRDYEGGVGYLVELDGWDKVVGEQVTLCFADFAFTTKPTDTLPNTHFLERVQDAGNYERFLFGTGTTHGQLSVGSGVIELAAIDGALDNLRPAWMAFDGYDLTIKTVERLNPRYEDAVVVFRGTVEQVEMTWAKATIRLRDRLAALDVEFQDDVFAGTTTAGGMDEAEGTADDLKDRPKPLAYGAPALVPAVEANRFDHIYALGNDGLEGIEDVRDKGVPLTASGSDYPTVAALRAATVSAGYYATSLANGLIKTGSAPAGELTVRPVEKASPSNQTAAQVARRILERKGFVANQHFLVKDIEALDELNAAPIGYWTGTDEQTTLQVLQRVLGSIGATIVPDRLGVFRMLRLDPPSGYPPLTITEAEALEVQGGRGIQLLATGDQGKGVPAWRVTVRYGYNWHPMSRQDLDPGAVGSDPAFAAFASEEWRNAVAEDEAVKNVHKLASDLVFETYLINEADAQAEAERLLAMHSVARDRFRIPVKTYLTDAIDLGSVVRLQLSRFGLNNGKDFRVIGMADNHKTRITTLDLWG